MKKSVVIVFSISSSLFFLDAFICNTLPFISLIANRLLKRAGWIGKFEGVETTVFGKINRKIHHAVAPCL